MIEMYANFAAIFEIATKYWTTSSPSFSLWDSRASETRARMTPFSRGVISRALAFRSLYYP